MSTFVPNQESAGPVTSVVFFVLLFLSGLWFPLKASSGLAQFSSWFPLRRFIEAVFLSFNVQGAYRRGPGATSWSWRRGVWPVSWSLPSGSRSPNRG